MGIWYVCTNDSHTIHFYGEYSASDDHNEIVRGLKEQYKKIERKEMENGIYMQSQELSCQRTST